MAFLANYFSSFEPCGDFHISISGEKMLTAENDMGLSCLENMTNVLLSEFRPASKDLELQQLHTNKSRSHTINIAIILMELFGQL